MLLSSTHEDEARNLLLAGLRVKSTDAEVLLETNSAAGNRLGPGRTGAELHGPSAKFAWNASCIRLTWKRVSVVLL